MPSRAAIADVAFFPMHKFSALLVVATLLSAPIIAQTKKKASDTVDLGKFGVVVDNAAIAVRVSGSNVDLGLAQTAFNTHGRYKLVGSAPAYDIKFTGLSGTQVRVDVTRGAAATPVVSQVVSGPSPRQALLAAADVAVEKTNGLGLRGYFTARMAFISERSGRKEVYVSDLFYGDAKQVTHDGALALTPRWSPDGSRVIYTSFYKTNAPDVYLQNVVTGQRDIVANYKGTNMGARFSPNGQQIVMVLSVQGAPEIWVKGIRGEPVRLTRSETVKSSPCWSPDGSQILFAMGEPGPQLYVMPASGGGARRVATGFTYMAEPDWSRTARNKIACTVRVAGGKYQIATVDVGSGETKVVSKADFDGIEPSWLADGRHVVYTARNRSTSVLCILDTETGKSTPLNSSETRSMQASIWTP